MSTPRAQLSRRSFTTLAVAGFAITPIAAWSPTAIAGAGTLGLITTTTGLLTTTGGIVALIVFLLRPKSTEKKSAGREGAEGELARRIIDSAMLSNQGDLALHLTLLSESPAAFAQFNAEVQKGEGRGLDSMQRATLIGADRLALHWQAAAQGAAPIDSEVAATRAVITFLQAAAPELVIRPHVRGELSWALLREASTGDVGAPGGAHAWMAEWLGVPAHAVAAASRVARSGLSMVPEAQLRAYVHDEPDAVLDLVAFELGSRHRGAIEAQRDELIRQCRDGLPSELADLATLGAIGRAG